MQKSTKERFKEEMQGFAQRKNFLEHALSSWKKENDTVDSILRGHDAEVDTILDLRAEALHKIVMSHVTLARVAERKLEKPK